MFSLFKEENGMLSMRRVLAFLFALASIVSGGFCIYKGFIEPKTILAAFGVPALVSIILLLFTTWDDLSKMARSVRGKDE